MSTRRWVRCPVSTQVPHNGGVSSAPEPGMRAARALLSDPQRTDAEVARLTRTAPMTVARWRHRLEADGAIPALPKSSRTRNMRAGERARLALAAHPERGNAELASLARCAPQTVYAARRQLEREGAIPPHACGDPRPPRGPKPSRTRAAIAQLGTDATPRQVADLAEVSTQAAWKMLRDVRAAEEAEQARKRAERTRPARRLGAVPVILDLPQQPASLTRGLCATAPPGRRAWWTSEDPAERKAARRFCLACPALAECRAWALGLPVADADVAVYGGMLAEERRRLKRATSRRAG